MCVVFSLWLWTIYDQCQCELIWISFIQRKRLRSWYQYIFLNFCYIYHSISWRWSVENCFKKRSKTNNTALILSIKYFKTPSNEDQTSVDSESKDKGDSIWPFYYVLLQPRLNQVHCTCTLPGTTHQLWKAPEKEEHL